MGSLSARLLIDFLKSLSTKAADRNSGNMSRLSSVANLLNHIYDICMSLHPAYQFLSRSTVYSAPIPAEHDERAISKEFGDFGVNVDRTVSSVCERFWSPSSFAACKDK
jgi:hypothetical protein